MKGSSDQLGKSGRKVTPKDLETEKERGREGGGSASVARHSRKAAHPMLGKANHRHGGGSSYLFCLPSCRGEWFDPGGKLGE